MMRWPGRLASWLAPALGVAVVAGCLVELPAACGDGRVDLTSESCDPAAPGPNNGDDCDPFTCRPLSELGCGNGTLDVGEECDHTAFGLQMCPSGKGFLSCTADCKIDESTCDPCGNNQVDIDAGEECDPTAPLGGPTLCSDLTSYPMKPYTSGQVAQCTDKCRWYRGPCGYCGDNEADDPQLVDIRYPETMSRWELCDGEDIRMSDLHNYCDAKCPLPGLSCTPICSEDCRKFETVDAEALHCCLPSGADCPNPDALAPCCAGFAPGVTDPFASSTCELRFKTDDQGQPVPKNVCR